MGIIRNEVITMDKEVIVAIMSVVCTALSAFAGIVISAKLTNFRLEQLEKKVDKHNNFAERIPVIEEKLKDNDRRIEVLENAHS